MYVTPFVNVCFETTIPYYNMHICHMIFFVSCGFTNFVIVCFEAAIQHYNMHHLCVKVFTNLDIVCYEAA